MSKNASLVEAKLVFNINSIYVNRVFVSVLADGLIKITFADSSVETGDVLPKQSVVVSPAVALQVRDIMTRVIDAINEANENNNSLSDQSSKAN